MIVNRFQEKAIDDLLRQRIERRRSDSRFMQRLKLLAARNRPALDRLKSR